MDTHFNSQFRFIDKSMGCNICSDRFYTFTKAFLKLNTDIYRLEANINRYNFRNTSYKFSLLFTEIIYYINIFWEGIDNPFEYDSHNHEVMKRYKDIKFPLISPIDGPLNEYLLMHPDIIKKGYLSLTDLHNFYNYSLNINLIRKDINDKGLFIEKHEIKWLEKKYNKSYSELDFANGDDIMVSTKYSLFKTILLNYLDYCYCSECTKKKNYIESISESLYIKSCLLTIMFDMLTTDIMLEILYIDKFRPLRELLSTKLNEATDLWIIPCYRWKGRLVYLRKLGIIPSILASAKIPLEHYHTRVFGLFSESIISHPLASHGLLYETLVDMQSIGAVC